MTGATVPPPVTLEDHITQALAGLKLSRPACLLLAHLHQLAEQSDTITRPASALAADLALPEKTIIRAAARLERQGLIGRELATSGPRRLIYTVPRLAEPHASRLAQALADHTTAPAESTEPTPAMLAAVAGLPGAAGTSRTSSHAAAVESLAATARSLAATAASLAATAASLAAQASHGRP